jgi:hypothetical protein
VRDAWDGGSYWGYQWGTSTRRLGMYIGIGTLLLIIILIIILL